MNPFNVAAIICFTVHLALRFLLQEQSDLIWVGWAFLIAFFVDNKRGAA